MSHHKLQLPSSILIPLSIFLFFACERAPEKKNDVTQTLATGSAAQSASNASGSELKSQVLQIQADQFKEGEISKALCTELQNIRNLTECSVLNKLVESTQLSSCMNSGQGTTLSKTYQAKVSGASTPTVRLSANRGAFYTKSFPADGSLQTLEWKIDGAQNVSSPRLIDLTDLVVVNESGTGVSVAQAELFLNSKSLLSQAGGQFNLESLRTNYKESSCRKSSAAVAELKSAAAAQPVPSQNINAAALEGKSDSELRTLYESLKTAVDITRSNILAIEKELLTDENRGCWADASLSGLKIKINGRLIDDAEGNVGFMIVIGGRFIETGPLRGYFDQLGSFKNYVDTGTQLKDVKLRELREIRVGFRNVGPWANSAAVSSLEFMLENELLARVPLANGGEFFGNAFSNDFDVSVQGSPEYQNILQRSDCKSL